MSNRIIGTLASCIILALVFTVISLTYIVSSYFQDLESSPPPSQVFASTQQTVKYEYNDVVFEYEDVRLPYNISQSQYDILIRAGEIAKEVGIKRPTKFQALLWQETHAGGLKSWRVAGHETLKPLKRYYGIGQIKVAAAWDMIKKHPSLNRFSHTGNFSTHDEVMAHLALDDEFNLWVAAYYFKWMGRGNVSQNYQITAYNRGYAGAKHIDDLAGFYYTKMVNQHERTIIKTVHEYTRKIRTANNTNSEHRENLQRLAYSQM